VKYPEEPYQLIQEMDLSSLLEQKDKKYGHINLPINTKGVVGLKVEIKSYKLLPPDNQYAGNKSWLFIDELIVK
jgi:hypothetical protein